MMVLFATLISLARAAWSTFGPALCSGSAQTHRICASRPLSQPRQKACSPSGATYDPSDCSKAYRHGIFPWYSDDQPILWWSPDPRTVLFPDKLHISRSLKRSLRPGLFSVTLDTCFRDVMQHCAGPRPQYPDGGTWITAEMLDAYTRLHEQGYAHSVETWQEGQLVGGLYGVALGGAFFAESMFTRVPTPRKWRWSRSCANCRPGDFASWTANNPPRM